MQDLRRRREAGTPEVARKEPLQRRAASAACLRSPDASSTVATSVPASSPPSRWTTSSPGSTATPGSTTTPSMSSTAPPVSPWLPGSPSFVQQSPASRRSGKAAQDPSFITPRRLSSLPSSRASSPATFAKQSPGRSVDSDEEFFPLAPDFPMTRPSSSLASGLLAFAPPQPDAGQIRAAAAAQASDDLRELISAAHRAAAVCPQCAPLAETLGTVATKELATLRQEQALEESATVVEQHASEIRVAAQQGLQVLHQALRSFDRSEGMKLTDIRCSDAPAPKVHARGAPSSPSPATPRAIPGTAELEEAQKVALRKLLGSVASDLKGAIDQIRAARASGNNCHETAFVHDRSARNAMGWLSVQ